MKNKKIRINVLVSYWGDIAQILIISLLSIVKNFTPSGGWFAIIALLICIGVLLVAIIRFVIYKKRNLRDWQYFFCWTIPVIILIPFAFYEFYSNQERMQHFDLFMEILTNLHRTFYSFRGAIFFYKRHEAKNKVAKSNPDLPLEANEEGNENDNT